MKPIPLMQTIVCWFALGFGGALVTGQSALALAPPPWGAVPFTDVDRVQPVFDQHCVSCHDGAGPAKLDLRGARDQYATPTSSKPPNSETRNEKRRNDEPLAAASSRRRLPAPVNTKQKDTL